MKVYVDELPESCWKCPCYIGVNCRCKLLHRDIDIYGSDKQKDCPLQSLTDHDKQVRKELISEIKEKLKPKEIFHPEDEFEIDYDFYYKEDVEELLDQIQGATK